MALWKVKFDHVNGEHRKCKLCGNDFHATRAVWRCKPCIAKINHDTAKKKYGETGLIPTGKWAGMEPKKPYPFDNRTSEANNRFAKIRAKLREAWKGGREELTKHYDNQLKEIQDNGIMEWILDRRADSDKQNAEVKSKTKINKEYPSTKDMPYE
jgi:hypothetical protein